MSPQKPVAKTQRKLDLCNQYENTWLSKEEQKIFEKDYKNMLKTKISQMYNTNYHQDQDQIELDKFDRPMDSTRKAYLANTFNPRIQHRLKTGERTMAEKKIIGQLARIRDKTVNAKIDVAGVTNQKVMGILSDGESAREDQEDEEVGEIDSLLESAFNSERNQEWDQYKMSIQQPPVSEASHE